MNAQPSRVGLITGGAGGIGAAMARRLAGEGVGVVIADVDAGPGNALAEELGGIFVATDVASPEQNQAAVQAAVGHFGRLDIAILNAGIGEPAGSLLEFDPRAYRRMAAVNYDGVVYGMHAALQHFTVQGAGAIIAVSSLAGLGESPLNPLYASAKHAVIGLVRSLAPAVAGQGITINALCPAFVDTAIIAEAVSYLRDLGVAVLEVEAVADAMATVLADGRTGQAWMVAAHRSPQPVTFPELPTVMADPSQVIPEAPA